MKLDVYQALELAAKRYRSLRTRFEQFHAHAKSLPNAGTPPLLADMSVSDLVAPGYFDVSLAGTTIRFQFEYLPDSTVGDKGVAVAYLFDRFTGMRADKAFGNFDFTSTGQTEHKFDGNGDPVSIADEHGSWYVVAKLLAEAIQRK